MCTKSMRWPVNHLDSFYQGAVSSLSGPQIRYKLLACTASLNIQGEIDENHEDNPK